MSSNPYPHQHAHAFLKGFSVHPSCTIGPITLTNAQHQNPALADAPATAELTVLALPEAGAQACIAANFRTAVDEGTLDPEEAAFFMRWSDYSQEQKDITAYKVLEALKLDNPHLRVSLGDSYRVAKLFDFRASLGAPQDHSGLSIPTDERPFGE